MTGSEDHRAHVISTVGRALTREAPRLTHRPHLLRQQLINRLQWDPDPIPQLLGDQADPKGTWLRLRSPIPEAPAFRQSLVGHRLPVVAAAINRAGELIATAGEDAHLIVWEAGTGGQLARWKACNGFLLGCCFAADRLVAVASDATVTIWSLDGTWLGSLDGHTGAVVGCDPSPDGQWLVTASDDGSAIVWDADSARIVSILKGPSLPPAACAFAPDGTRVATVGLDGVARLWDPATGNALGALRGHIGPVAACTFSPDGALATAGTDGTVRLWETDGTQRWAATGHEGRALTCAVLGDGLTVISGGDDRILRAWDASTGQPIAAAHGHSDGIYGCAVAPDGTYLVTTSRDLTARVWSTADLTSLEAERPGHRETVTGCAIISGTDTAATTGDDGELRFWSLGSLEPAGAIVTDTQLRSCASSADGRLVAAGGADEAVRVWDLTSARLLGEYHDRRTDLQIRSVRGCSLDATGERVAVMVESRVRVLDTSTGEETHRFERQREISPTLSVGIGAAAVTFLPNGDLLVAYRDGRLVSWASTGEERTIGSHPDDLEACAAAAGLVASTDETGRVRVWDLGTGRAVFDRLVHKGRARVCALSEDGTLVASGGDDRTVAVHDVASGHLLAQLPTEGWVTALAFAGRMVLAGDEGGSLYAADLITPGV